MNRRALPVAVLAGAGLFAALALPFLYLTPNRLLSGAPHSPQALALAATWALVAAFGTTSAKGGPVAVASMAWLLIAGLPLLASIDAHSLLLTTIPSARVPLGAGFWSMWLAAVLLMLDRLRDVRMAGRIGAWLSLLAALVAMGLGGCFDTLALVREFHAQRGPFMDALLTHLVLAATTLVLALVVGVPLGWWAWRTRRTDGLVVGGLAFLQTVPSLALFALLIGPFAWLAQAWPALGAIGFGGTGAAPAVFALVLYALLPVVRYTVAGLGAVPADARDAARGLGMSRVQLLARVQLPLGWPVLLAGLRIVAVQTIGLAAVATLIGAGGLGRFVFLGIGQGANDMVMLGTLAIIALALVVDLLFQAMLALTERRP
ncbi:MAG TPA: ABC transporter permease [Luteibacter sp.]|uniref:ABC transporter permease n=1 Tax=Luteibacter sp. TaxID=1886636 RepID=UPI002C0EC20F|nr:ABC transporter permease [Luteibacter sp.]HVI56775.1 ABC transporter permease [Luteibacter sp.]